VRAREEEDWCVQPPGSYQYLFEIYYIRIVGQSFVGVQQSRTFPRTAVGKYDMDLRVGLVSEKLFGKISHRMFRAMSEGVF
jgi:hypothetical protein